MVLKRREPRLPYLDNMDRCTIGQNGALLNKQPTNSIVFIPIQIETDIEYANSVSIVVAIAHNIKIRLSFLVFVSLMCNDFSDLSSNFLSYRI